MVARLPLVFYLQRVASNCVWLLQFMGLLAWSRRGLSLQINCSNG